MPVEILMPALSPSMESGTLLQWLTDGVFGEILVPTGTTGVSIGSATGLVEAFRQSIEQPLAPL